VLFVLTARKPLPKATRESPVALIWAGLNLFVAAARDVIFLTFLIESAPVPTRFNPIPKAPKFFVRFGVIFNLDIDADSLSMLFDVVGGIAESPERAPCNLLRFDICLGLTTFVSFERLRTRLSSLTVLIWLIVSLRWVIEFCIANNSAEAWSVRDMLIPTFTSFPAPAILIYPSQLFYFL
jgi:hypothetical protein